MTAEVCAGAEHRVDRNKYQIQIPLPPKIDPTVTMMTVEEKPDVTYSDIGGCKEQVHSWVPAACSSTDTASHWDILQAELPPVASHDVQS